MTGNAFSLAAAPLLPWHAIAALGADGPSTITGADAVAISYPDFFSTLERLCQ